MCTPPVHRGDNPAPRTFSISESSFLNQLPPGGPKPSNVDRVDSSGNARKTCCYNTNLTFNRPENNVYRTSAEFSTPSQTVHVNNTKPNNIIHSIDLTRSESPTFCSPQNRVNGMHNNCRFQTPTHDVARRETVHIEPTHPISVDVGRPERSPSPDIIPLGVFNLAVNRRPEFDLSITPQPMRNRTGSRRHARASGLRRNRMGNINNSAALDDGISPTTTRLMSEVSVSNDADEAVSLVRQMEDDEQYARRLQEEMDKEFAMSLHQADAGFAQSDHAGAFGAEEAACPPALSPTFLQYCRSPVRRRGYNSNRQPVIRRRRGAAAAEPEEASYEELVVDGPGFEHGARRFPPGSDHPLALMEAHILALLDNSPVTRRGRRRGNNGGRFLRNLHSPVGDGNDYEELLELAESLGEVKQKGMTKSELNRLPIRKFKSSDSSGNDTTDCLICMCDYQEGDSLRILPCCHEFHQPCIDKWLKNTATCPICRVDVKNSS
ncbi:probable E3 ubiquitin-protein ligase RHG1A isoform X3 [Haliotis rubra]|uniref:probable E3 ubiquitin-protein ligase RHG1A isoform X3 n=1 Tax=Haliotis rubra TaxID=36100 RepID=UPI001EE565C2|nr:probable E3 ubiquitin-protein ligase RHG1A isoform X3 [Haliotis rubra]